MLERPSPAPRHGAPTGPREPCSGHPAVGPDRGLPELDLAPAWAQLPLHSQLQCLWRRGDRSPRSLARELAHPTAPGPLPSLQPLRLRSGARLRSPPAPAAPLRSGPMLHSPPLRLYTRIGCCLCEGLEERLGALDPPPLLELVDVDGDPALQARYGLRVPVLARLGGPAGGGTPPALAWVDLPPVPPRLGGERLQAWLAAHGAVAGASANGGTPLGDGP